MDESRGGQFYGVKPGRYVSLSVTDEGTGMSAEVRERLFEPFYTTKPTGQGTGLGMSMVYGAVTQHGGTIHVESQPKHGSRVQILLPVANAGATSAPDAIGSSKQPATGNERILLAEDDELVRRTCVRALERAGYQVVAASNGAEAIELARTQKGFDLAVLDVVMPEATGPQAYAAIREIHPKLPVLFCSGYADVANLNHAIPEAAPILAKPLRVAVLLETVRRLLDKHRAG